MKACLPLFFCLASGLAQAHSAAHQRLPKAHRRVVVQEASGKFVGPAGSRALLPEGRARAGISWARTGLPAGLYHVQPLGTGVSQVVKVEIE